MSQNKELTSKEGRSISTVKVSANVSVPKGIETEVVIASVPTESTPIVDDMSYSTDDSFEIDPQEDRKRMVHATTTANANVQPAIPYLKGQYFRDDRYAYWTGKWGMSINGKITGDTSEFSYQIPCRDVTQSVLIPISGAYQGYFWMKYKPPQKIVETKMHLAFTENEGKFVVSGMGSNRLGSYNLHGVYDPLTQELNCYKEYIQHPPKVKTSRSEVPKETRSSTRYLNYLVTGGIDIPSTVPQHMHSCYRVHNKLMNHKWAFPFLQPVDPEALHIPDYFSIIKNPMDLGTIRTKLVNGEITTEEEYISQVRLVFDNAVLYNKPQDDVAIMANALMAFFEKEYKQLQRLESVIDSDPSAIVTRRRSTKRNSELLHAGSMQKKYSLRGSGYVDIGQKKPSTDLPRDVQPYQYHALEVFMKRLQGSILNKNVSEEKKSL